MNYNILFINFTYPEPENGGTERVIFNLSKYFVLQGYNVYICHFEGISGKIEFISNSIVIYNNNKSLHDFEQFLIYNKIDLIINFKTTLNYKILEIIKRLNLKLISSLRYAPNDSLMKIKSMISDKQKYVSFNWTIIRFIKFIYIPYHLYKISRKIRVLYKNSDKYILQSSNYIEDFVRFINISDKSKIRIINNSLPFENSLSSINLIKKKNIVLVVGRMEDKSKRFSIVLKIWKSIEKTALFKDWKIYFIGDGSDLNRYITMAKSYKLENIIFKGKQNPYQYYEEASIFLMTSIAEGFSNTLLEAIQMGCVPITFDSFLSLNDIITDNYNGCIIQNDNLIEFEVKLKWLILNKEIRLKMAKNAINSSKKFHIDLINKGWINLINELMDLK